MSGPLQNLDNYNSAPLLCAAQITPPQESPVMASKYESCHWIFCDDKKNVGIYCVLSQKPKHIRGYSTLIGLSVSAHSFWVFSSFCLSLGQIILFRLVLILQSEKLHDEILHNS